MGSTLAVMRQRSSTARPLRPAATAVRLVRTASGYALFDEHGRYVGAVRWLVGKPAFGAGAETVLLQHAD